MFACALSPCILAVPAAAETGGSITVGREHFVYSDLDTDVNVSSTVNLGIYYARYDDDFISPTRIYSANATLQAGGLYGALVSYYSPKSDDYTFYGGQAAVGYQGGSEYLKAGGSLTYGRTLNLLSGVPGGQMPLHENMLEPAVSLTFNKTTSLRFSYAFYFHQEDPTEFFEAQFGNPADLDDTVFVISGYPSREAGAGMSYYPSDRWQLALDINRLIFETYDVQLNSITWSATYYPVPAWGITGSYYLGNGALWYFTLGLRWFPGGHTPGDEKENAISYTDIP